MPLNSRNSNVSISFIHGEPYPLTSSGTATDYSLLEPKIYPDGINNLINFAETSAESKFIDHGENEIRLRGNTSSSAIKTIAYWFFRGVLEYTRTEIIKMIISPDLMIKLFHHLNL